MTRRRAKPPKPPLPGGPDEAAYAPSLQVAAQAVTTRVQEVHTAISDKAFRAVQAVPGLSTPAGLVQRAHDTIAGGVYAAVRGGTTAVLRLAAEAERFLSESRPPEGHELTLRSALNAAAGDAFAEAGSPLAVSMALCAQGQVLDDATSPAVWAGLGPRITVFIHGLACDERSWQLFADAWPDEGSQDAEPPHYGALLERELSFMPLFLRYNTGLSIADNAAGLAAQLDRLVTNAPQVREIVLIGHSMGGLVTRLACDQAAGADWVTRVRCVVCLGSPLRGAPLEKLGHFVSMALGASDVTRPLQTLANSRSQGIKDLRRGLPDFTRPRPPLRLVAGSLSDESTPGGRVVRRMLGDGLVTTRSALDAREAGDIERAELPGLGHMALLNHPRVYALLRQWLADGRSG